MKDELKTIIYNWVAKNFGESEADDPSWSIEALAEELAKHQHELYWNQELEYLKEDVENYVNGLNMGRKEKVYNLTEKQMYAVADKIRNSDWYCSINPEDMEFYINDELKKGE